MTYFRDNIEKLVGYTPGFQPGSADVVKLNTNENPYPPSPKVIEAVRNLPAESLRRYPQPLGDDFRKAAAKVHGITPENIICTNGGDDLLTICFRAFCDADRPVAYPSPTYSLYDVLAKLQGCRVIEMSWTDDRLFDSLAACGASLIIMCNPNAPTGHRIDREKLGTLASQIQGVMLIDEAYVDFAENDCIPLVQQYGNVILLRSMSKGYSLAGIRFGYGIAQARLIEGLLKVKDSYNVNAVSIAAATAAVSDREYFKGNVEKIKTQRSRLTDELRRIGFEIADSRTNFLLAKPPEGNAEYIHRRLAEQNIFVRYFKLPGLVDKLRISVGTDRQNDMLIDAVKKILEK